MEKRESENVEFKKSTSEVKEGVISLASMLNKNHQGKVYFGVKNDGSIFGQQIGTQTTNSISKAIKENIKPQVIPEITVLQIEGKQVIQVQAVGEDTPYCAYNRYYIRSDDEDLIMTNPQLEEFFLNKNYDYSDWEQTKTEYTIDDVDEDLLIKYINKGNDCNRINFLYKDVKTTLSKLNLLCGENLNNAGYYLFSNKKPVLLKLAVYPSDERISFTDLKQFNGNIFECIEQAIHFISNNIKWGAQIIGMERKETPEIPIEAFREIIVNSFAHAKYNQISSHEIYVTPGKIHIYNPGSLVPGTTPDHFAKGNQGSMIRNPLIATALYYSNTIDAFGTGFERVFKLCKNLDYQYQNTPFGFTFEFIRKIANSAEVNTFINEKLLSNDEKKIIALIEQGQLKTKKDFCREIQKSITSVNRILKKLQDLRLIERTGSNKTGYWIIKK